MIRATTPTFTLTIPSYSSVDLTEAANVYFTISQSKAAAITKEVTPTDAKTVEVSLTQAEALSLKEGSADIQLNWTYADGSRAATLVRQITIKKQLLLEVVS